MHTYFSVKDVKLTDTNLHAYTYTCQCIFSFFKDVKLGFVCYYLSYFHKYS